MWGLPSLPDLVNKRGAKAVPNVLYQSRSGVAGEDVLNLDLTSYQLFKSVSDLDRQNMPSAIICCSDVTALSAVLLSAGGAHRDCM